jgi:hypothetical protein
LLGVGDMVQIIQLGILVIAVDTLVVIPFVKLRHEERPVKYAIVRVAGIFINLLLVWFFVNYCPEQIKKIQTVGLAVFLTQTEILFIM